MKNLSPRRTMVLCFIARYQASNGYAPTVREINAAIGACPTYTGDLVALRKSGLLTQKPGRSRTMRLTAAGQLAATEAMPAARRKRAAVPMVGAVA